MQRRIAVENLDRLADLNAEHVRNVSAIPLIEHEGRRWSGERATQATLHVDEYVAEGSAVADDERLLRRSLSFVRLDADRIGIHSDGCICRRRAFERDLACNRRCSRRIDRRCGRRRCRVVHCLAPARAGRRRTPRQPRVIMRGTARSLGCIETLLT